MPINAECVYDVLTYIEREFMPNREIVIEEDKIPEELSAYDAETLKYHLKKCAENDLISGYRTDVLGDCYISDITSKGLEVIHGKATDRKDWLKFVGNIVSIAQIVAKFIN